MQNQPLTQLRSWWLWAVLLSCLVACVDEHVELDPKWPTEVTHDARSEATRDPRAEVPPTPDTLEPTAEAPERREASPPERSAPDTAVPEDVCSPAQGDELRWLTPLSPLTTTMFYGDLGAQAAFVPLQITTSPDWKSIPTTVYTDHQGRFGFLVAPRQSDPTAPLLTLLGPGRACRSLRPPMTRSPLPQKTLKDAVEPTMCAAFKTIEFDLKTDALLNPSQLHAHSTHPHIAAIEKFENKPHNDHHDIKLRLVCRIPGQAMLIIAGADLRAAHIPILVSSP